MKSFMPTRVRQAAFTLIEMLMVLAILAILAALLIPKLIGTSHKRDIIACAGNLKKLGAAFHLYVQENKGYAPFNPNSNEAGDNFYSWEALYLLAPYLDDPDHKKFEAGTWNTVRCPGNKCNYYRTGSAVNESGTQYSILWQNRQAFKKWPATTVVAGKTTTIDCSPGEQIVDYQYNVNLGGSFQTFTVTTFPAWYATHPANYKLSFILQFPSEAVIFCDIQYANVLHLDQNIPGKDKFVYAYPKAGDLQWGAGGNGASPPGMRTNERVHNGKGINAVFVDGRVEFLPEVVAYNGYGKRDVYDDLLNWGISYPICYPNAANKYDQIPGIHGYRRKQNQSVAYNFSWCIEHEYKKGLRENDGGTCFFGGTG